MKLQKAIIRPGNVLQILENGIIKASAPGLFSFVDDPDKLPPIMPWQIGSNSNSFSKPLIDDEVWIMNFLDNPRQLYWFRKDKIQNNVNIDTTGENVEVICNRDLDGEWATIYLSDGTGWIISKGESVMQIRPNGSIKLSTGFDHRTIDINTKGISLGTEGSSEHPAAYGDVIVSLFESLIVLLKNIQISAMPNPYTTAIAQVIATNLPNIESQLPNIVSPHVTLD